MSSPTLDDLCQLMHDTYEAAAIRHGWYTNVRSRVAWGQVPVENKAAMRDAIRVVEEAVREDERAKYSAEVFVSDLRQIMQILDISIHARPVSPHEVVQNEVLPRLRKMVQYSPGAVQSDLTEIMQVLNINAHASSSPHELIQNQILPALYKMVEPLHEAREDNRKLKRILSVIRAANKQNYLEVKKVLDEGGA